MNGRPSDRQRAQSQDAAWENDREPQWRERAWLRARLRGDRRRWPSVTARACAFLQLVDLERERARARIDPVGSREFFHLLGLVERMASGLPIYHLVNGELAPMGEVKGGSDPRLRAFKRLLELTEIARWKFDSSADSIDVAMQHQRRGHERGLRAAEHYVRALEKSVRPPPGASSGQEMQTTSVYGKGELTKRRLRALEESLRIVEQQLRDLAWGRPGDPLRGFGDELLGYIDDGYIDRDASIDGPPPSIKDTPARRAAMLRAACEILAEYDAKRRTALKRRSAMLLEEFPGGAGDGPRYAARCKDLDAELLQSHQEGITRFRKLVIRYAVRVESMSAWPPGNTKFDRAFAFGQSITVPAFDLAMARATLGHASKRSPVYDD